MGGEDTFEVILLAEENVATPFNVFAWVGSPTLKGVKRACEGVWKSR